MKKIIILIAAVMSLGVAYWLISPVFIDRYAVDDSTADIDAAIANALDGTYKDEDIVMTENLKEQLGEEVMPDFLEEMKKIGDVFSDEPAFVEMEHMIRKEETQEGGVEAKEGLPVQETGPALLKSGMFVAVAHDGSGRAHVVDLGGDKGTVLRIEDLDILNGPDLRVVLSSNTGVQSSDELGDYVELGKLRGNKGSQNYALPAGLDIASVKSVIIYCKPFHVVFNTADLY
ncbi:MAG: hypothetical protein COU33_05240 [Candidatus Magasanikbacteria bacterium CG10_big_fil_rev_8_21_14_0_10_43_6]|uniref:DM13 domain-containing protein n=1 Tax=Candidatus Magasanikbacteria bacterium CG10_big_fil_rev_8_21_14_0_10_43_6 TaxID=1974650 RepID=A0A2M6W019_9BACT|nr:MAG: hypothetical protein COU33_05240 [Candidatus Magasanikbacteria bacterium CG10_big_fil_rev_8_21_14_0_10_43_6]